MIKELTCIICPNGCDITAEVDGKNIHNIEGALCKRGEDYVHQEIISPQRNIATSVKINNADIPLVSVRLTNTIPKEKIFEVMEEIKKQKVDAPSCIGQIVIKNVLNLNSDVIITKNVPKIS